MSEQLKETFIGQRVQKVYKHKDPLTYLSTAVNSVNGMAEYAKWAQSWERVTTHLFSEEEIKSFPAVLVPHLTKFDPSKPDLAEWRQLDFAKWLIENDANV